MRPEPSLLPDPSLRTPLASHIGQINNSLQGVLVSSRDAMSTSSHHSPAEKYTPVEGFASGAITSASHSLGLKQKGQPLMTRALDPGIGVFVVVSSAFAM